MTKPKQTPIIASAAKQSGAAKQPRSPKQPPATAVPSGSGYQLLTTDSLQSLRLIAAPKPGDDLSETELEEMARQNRYPADIIQNIIQTIKNI